MKRLPKGYRPLTKEQRERQRDVRFGLMCDQMFREAVLAEGAGILEHTGDRRTCPRCKAGIP